VIWRVTFFLGVAVAVGLAAVLLGRHLWGDQTALAAAIACGVCLVPATATLLWSEWAMTWSPQQQVTAVLGGSGLRLLVVGVAAFALFQQVPFLHAEESHFWNWVLAFYLVTLALEVVVLLWAQSGRRHKQAST